MKQKVVFMGTPDFAVPALRSLAGMHDVTAVYTREPKPGGRNMAMQKTPVHMAAEDLGIPVFTPQSFRKFPNEVKALRAIAPDIIIVFAYGLILPQSVLDIAPCVCVHPSLLPLYRGPNPIQRAILNDDGKTGITLMRMDAGVDSGPMLVQREIDLPADMTLGKLEALIAELAPGMLLDYLERRDSITPRPQPSEFTLAPKLDKDGARIDWSRPATEIHNLIRACNPHPKARFTHDGGPVKALGSIVIANGIGATQAGKGPRDNADGNPGLVLDDSLAIACGGGTAIRLLELQRPGGKPLPARDFLNGCKIKSGEVLE